MLKAVFIDLDGVVRHWFLSTIRLNMSRLPQAWDSLDISTRVLIN
jgi:hypothetical protein